MQAFKGMILGVFFQHLFPIMKGFLRLIIIPGEKGQTQMIWIHKVSIFLRLILVNLRKGIHEKETKRGEGCIAYSNPVQ